MAWTSPAPVTGALGQDRDTVFGAGLTGVRLCADDLGWPFGSGAPLYGRGQDLLLAAYGRGLPAGRLRGDEVHRFVTA
ncbi:hypothetical protein [Streptomyces sp. NPDC007205]|uniref:hypothetical protein n=1 Tax=Streptomyces sp. NPDC007205 TaxID=3154316 RepID=UPI0033FA2D57